MPKAKRKICQSCGSVHHCNGDICWVCAKKKINEAFRAAGNGTCVICKCRIPDNRLRISKYCFKCSLESSRQSVDASNKVRAAIKKGLVKPISSDTVCVDCGKPAHDLDHRDYNNPLEVVPVCRGCNIRRGPAIHKRAA